MKKLICFFFGHKYSLAQNLHAHSRRVYCTRCKCSFAMNDDVRSIVPWDAEFHKMYESHGVEIKYLEGEFRHSSNYIKQPEENTMKREELFNSMINLKHDIQHLAGHVQNDMAYTNSDIVNMIRDFKHFKGKLQNLENEFVIYYEKKLGVNHRS
jgi:Prophage protein (DUF1660)